MALDVPEITAAEEEDDVFFDTSDELSPAPAAAIEVWISDPGTVRERREEFIRSLSANLTRVLGKEDSGRDSLSVGVNSSGDADSSVVSDGRQSGSLYSSESADCVVPDERFACVIKNLDDGTVFVVDEIAQDGSFNQLREVGSNKTVTTAEFDRHFGSSPFIQQLMRRGGEVLDECIQNDNKKRRKMGWLRRLGIKACIIGNEMDESSSNSGSASPSRSWDDKGERVKVRTHKKSSKELSAIYKGQDFRAHHGLILTMKFSRDGQYLATGGEDRVVRIWRVVEREWIDVHDSPRDDLSFVYFPVDVNSEEGDGDTNKLKMKSKKNEDSASVLIPFRTFWLSENPVHEFQGHGGDILDLSWSQDKLLLSSSVDKTVRLWQVGCSSCLKVFPHKDFVTSVHFKPLDDNTFVSGSIDGIIRVWEISECHVVDWADTKEIVTAVCYQPDGKGGVFGTITGNCRFYDIVENQLELGTRVCLNGKKKSPLKRITGLQYHPTDPTKLMVTSANAQVRILEGTEVISNYKGLRGSSQVSASFTVDGKHIISAGDDSNIYMWNYASRETLISNHTHSVSSYERFFSEKACLAIPWNWNTTQNRNSISLSCSVSSADSSTLKNTSCNSASSGNFFLNTSLISQYLPRGSATWPEEKLASSRASSTLRKSELKLLKASLQETNAWGHVMVTAGWDGHIRTFYNYGLPRRG